MMSNKPNLGSINFRKYPYRGILSEIARIVGRTPETVGEGVRRGNPKYCEMAAKEIQRRTKLLKKEQAIVAEAMDATA